MTIYFAYGSNMDFSRMRERGINFKFIGKGILFDHQLKFNKEASNKIGVGYANIEKADNYTVEGLLFEVHNLQDLDKYEGYPKHYTRELMDIYTATNQKIEAVVYVASKDKINNYLKPEKEYLDKLKKAKQYLSEEYYTFLENIDFLNT